jgi:pantetheine-phosphate adenylyltransferase
MGYTVGEFITKKRVAMLTGSFDPITKGHEALIDEGLNLYDEIVVALLVNEEKEYFFTPDERLEIVRATIKDKKGVRALYSTDMAVDVAIREGASVFLRGVRGDDDRAYEEDIRQYNLTHGGIDTVILELDTLHTVSSTRAREEIMAGDYHSIPVSAVLVLDKIMKDKNK